MAKSPCFRRVDPLNGVLALTELESRNNIFYVFMYQFQLADIYQPSVIFIGDAEKTFYKKVPKTEKHLDPKRLKKPLPKAMKDIKKDKRIILIGTSNAPFEAEVKSFMKTFERLVMVPRPNYGDRRLIWSKYVSDKLTDAQTKHVSVNIEHKIFPKPLMGQIIRLHTGIYEAPQLALTPLFGFAKDLL